MVAFVGAVEDCFDFEVNFVVPVVSDYFVDFVKVPEDGFGFVKVVVCFE